MYLSLYQRNSLNLNQMIRMFCNNSIKKEIFRIHKRALYLVCKDYVSTFHELLEKAFFQKTHAILRALVLEMHRSQISPKFIREIIKADISCDRKKILISMKMIKYRYPQTLVIFFVRSKQFL